MFNEQILRISYAKIDDFERFWNAGGQRSKKIIDFLLKEEILRIVYVFLEKKFPRDVSWWTIDEVKKPKF